ncbi:uncharacterized protein [Triticum aestivum]|uniref:uncharacterized protein isoform X2 n=1 Tax=Triticum aestivum TaxID=4565 RepID=UPI001D029264|nr:uncharacterized protein LOC123119837 isoform X2 [Triticum aestivum]
MKERCVQIIDGKELLMGRTYTDNHHVKKVKQLNDWKYVTTLPSRTNQPFERHYVLGEQKLLGRHLGGFFVLLRRHHCNLNKGLFLQGMREMKMDCVNIKKESIDEGVKTMSVEEAKIHRGLYNNNSMSIYTIITKTKRPVATHEHFTSIYCIPTLLCLKPFKRVHRSIKISTQRKGNRICKKQNSL